MSILFHHRIRIGAFQTTVAMTRSVGWSGYPAEEPPSGDAAGDSAGIGIVESARRTRQAVLSGGPSTPAATTLGGT